MKSKLEEYVKDWKEEVEKKCTFPEKWYTKINKNTISFLHNYMHSNSANYSGWKDSWKISKFSIGRFFYLKILITIFRMECSKY